MGTITDTKTICPECHHREPFAPSEFAGMRKLFRMRPAVSCAHVDVEQDALADMEDRCGCIAGWHLNL